MENKISELASLYLAEKSKRREPNTVYGYISSINLHVLPEWGDMRISDITHNAVQDWVDSLSKVAGIGGAWKAYKCLRQIIRWAMDRYSLFVADPTRGVEKPKDAVYRPEVLTEPRLKRLIRGLVGCEYEATGIIQAALGCRPSENYYLHWEWINWRTGQVHLKGALHEIPNKLYESLTKTAKGDRLGYLPPWALSRLRDIWISLNRPHGRIIGDAKPSKVYRSIKRWVDARKLPWVGMKNLRHTWGSIAAKHNSIEAVSAMMGHSNIQTTYRYYYDLSASTIKQVQQKVARSIIGKSSNGMYKDLLGIRNPKLF